MSVFDPGLQPERTALAWRRTALALLVGSLVALRILPEVFGTWAVALGLVGVVAAGALLWAVHRRYSTHHRLLTDEGDRAALAGGRLIAALTLFCVAAAALTLALVITMAATGWSLFTAR
ncbi:DUF202 domain-containing protein [Herbiconiux sp. KACC 21604]|uniref:DUF202 domain-containing protein n=1 Tax=unclassified Herbiconiux TaxID=2618217 RepID=UPI001492915E|nr:DUF202 domain-containing protein [Herbiconiux sp. SALV-R1]QJU55132.1 DUF202 domain-containing protein [Herbiconiux sp. SALV-R1]WPO86283.1 DUF202 domain-containing protein [Herbiconiux sp. KACC 21604]